jgi:hypothetical protein
LLSCAHASRRAHGAAAHADPGAHRCRSRGRVPGVVACLDGPRRGDPPLRAAGPAGSPGCGSRPRPGMGRQCMDRRRHRPPVAAQRGQRTRGRLASADIEALYGHAVGPWWDLLLGARNDSGGGPSRQWAAIGVQGWRRTSSSCRPLPTRARKGARRPGSRPTTTCC